MSQREPGLGGAVKAEAALAPGARDDQRLDEVALHAVEVGRLVMLVEEPERASGTGRPWREAQGVSWRSM